MTADTPAPARLGRNSSNLGRQVAEALRTRIMGGAYAPGTRLPSETDISDTYGVSRVTVRTAIKMLESQGLVDVRHGSGTYVCDFGGQIRAGVQELRSITETIEEMGFTPRMELHRRDVRPATAEEAEKLGVAEGFTVIALDRAIYADDEVVAYSHDIIPAENLPAQVIAQLGTGSMFGVLDQIGYMPVRALAEIHAVNSPDVGWGSQRPESGLYILLDQVHFDRRGRVVAHSKTYFVEGRFQFVILRTR